MLIGATLGRYFAWRFVRTILGVFLTVFALVYTLDFVELLRRAGDAEGASPGLMAQLGGETFDVRNAAVLPPAVKNWIFTALRAYVNANGERVVDEGSDRNWYEDNTREWRMSV